MLWPELYTNTKLKGVLWATSGEIVGHKVIRAQSYGWLSTKGQAEIWTFWLVLTLKPYDIMLKLTMSEFLKRCSVRVKFRQNPWGSDICVDLTWNDPQRDPGRFVTCCNIKPTEGRHTRKWWPTIPIHVSNSWCPEKQCSWALWPLALGFTGRGPQNILLGVVWTPDPFVHKRITLLGSALLECHSF